MDISYLVSQGLLHGRVIYTIHGLESLRNPFNCYTERSEEIWKPDKEKDFRFGFKHKKVY